MSVAPNASGSPRRAVGSGTIRRQEIGVESNWRNGVGFRVPGDLDPGPLRIPRVLVIGSCLVGAVPDYINRAWGEGCADWIPLNNMAKLPSEPPRPIAQYDCQFIQIATRSILREQQYLDLDASDPVAWKRLFKA